MYRLISTISIFLRTFIFPNPFEKYIELYLIDSPFEALVPTIAYVFNLSIGGTILCFICYPLVGIVHGKGDNPALGSILYGVFVLINSKILVWIAELASECSFNTFIAIGVAILIVEAAILIWIRYIKDVKLY